MAGDGSKWLVAQKCSEWRQLTRRGVKVAQNGSTWLKVARNGICNGETPPVAVRIYVAWARPLTTCPPDEPAAMETIAGVHCSGDPLGEKLPVPETLFEWRAAHRPRRRCHDNRDSVLSKTGSTGGRNRNSAVASRRDRSR